MQYKKNIFRLKATPSMRAFAADLNSSTQKIPEELLQLSWRRRKKLLNHAYENVPHYKRSFSDVGLTPNDLKDETDFQKIPILEKADIRANQSELFSQLVNPGRLRPLTTGGTTGEPLTVFHDPEVPTSVMSWRMLESWGVDISDNSAYLYRGIPRGLRKHLIDFILYPTRRTYIAAAEMSLVNMGRFTSELLRIKPKYLVGYVGAIDAYADYLNKVNIQLPSLQAIWTTSAPLPELKRNYFNRTFDCSVYTQYGCVECYTIAAECRCHTGLHLYNDIRHVEIVDSRGKPVPHGEWGDVLITDMLNRAFPLIRYRLGDRGRFLNKRCNCGSPFPLIDYIRGRISDKIILSDGTSVPGEYWTTIFDDYPDSIKSFQVYQYKNYKVEIRYEPSSFDCSKTIGEVSAKINQMLMGRVDVTFRQCAINNNENGKTRFVKSELVP